MTIQLFKVSQKNQIRHKYDVFPDLKEELKAVIIASIQTYYLRKNLFGDPQINQP